jgi:hypothetical protein
LPTDFLARTLVILCGAGVRVWRWLSSPDMV